MSTDASSAALHALVYGRVQGVGFREFVRRQAEALGLTGWVRNLADERAVELEATGNRAALEQLVRSLHEGPRLANVSRVEIEWLEPGSSGAGFVIRT